MVMIFRCVVDLLRGVQFAVDRKIRSTTGLDMIIGSCCLHACSQQNLRKRACMSDVCIEKKDYQLSVCFLCIQLVSRHWCSVY